jgi:hypothetical protein
MGNAGYEVRTATFDVFSRTRCMRSSVPTGIGEIVGLVHAAGVSPSQASPHDSSRAPPSCSRSRKRLGVKSLSAGAMLAVLFDSSSSRTVA